MSAVVEQPEVLHEFELGHRGTVRATVETFKGKLYASVRLWVEPREQPGANLIPTPKGLSVPLEYVPDLLEATQRVQPRHPRNLACQAAVDWATGKA